MRLLTVKLITRAWYYYCQFTFQLNSYLSCLDHKIKGSSFYQLKVKFAQFCPTLCNPMDYIVHGILQARLLEWVAFSFSRESGIFPIQGSNSGLLHCRWILYQLSIRVNFISKNRWARTPLVVQWLRIHPPMQEVGVQSLVRELRSHMPKPSLKNR